MHEFSLAEDLLKLAIDEASKAGIVQLDKITVRIGTVSGVNVDALEFAWGFLRDTEEITKNTELVVEHVQGIGRCKSCGRESELDRIFLFCPYCESPSLEIISGREFILARLEGEDDSSLPDAEPEKSEIKGD